jgi:hypothetical protein
MFKAAFCASWTNQKIIASTFTGTVSFRQRLLGAKGRGLNAFIDDGYHVVDNRNDQEKSRPFYAEQFSRAKDDEFLPGVGHLQRRGDDNRCDYNGDARIKVSCYAQSRTHGEAGDSQK